MELVYQENQKLAEGPLWHDGYLYWVDIKACKLHQLNLDTREHRARHFPQQLTSIAPTRSGEFVVTTRDGVAGLANFDASLKLLVDIEGSIPTNRFNDAKVDSYGNLWAGSMDDEETNATGTLYRIDNNLTVSTEDTGYHITNGPAFSRNGEFLYHTDSVLKKIYRFGLSKDGITDKQLFIELGPEHGHPDGMTVDDQGNIWVCEYGGWGISTFDSTGKYLNKIEVPVANVTSCSFGGKNLDTLFITTAAQGLTEAELAQQPLAGSIFQTKPGVTGVASHLFNH
ncbi:SMP-30/gluconolactonase/LRE family protein [Pseudomonadales bacterium]|nr:SMP-30/gluconolactonase/LRE family protein [Pseudomonadales bacterium]MDB3989830.1 SMP-30/gluconolactonase/LRE family protein [Pseudomonadales bacterium]MDC0893555.1 SMP-30/gluconolactonase/LRE family protein [Pseudomonadales bacterium]